MITRAATFARQRPAILSLGLFWIGFVLPSLLAAAQGAVPEKDSPRPKSRTAGQLSAMWWNDEALGTKLELTAEQRKFMDLAFKKFKARRQKMNRDQRDARKAVAFALRAADWQRAQVTSEAVADAAAAMARAETELKVEVLRHLTTAQLAGLTELRPKVLEQPWSRLGIARRLRQKARSRQGQQPGTGNSHR